MKLFLMGLFNVLAIANLICGVSYADINTMVDKCPICTHHVCQQRCIKEAAKTEIKSQADYMRKYSAIYNMCMYQVCPEIMRSQKCAVCYQKYGK